MVLQQAPEITKTVSSALFANSIPRRRLLKLRLKLGGRQLGYLQLKGLLEGGVYGSLASRGLDDTSREHGAGNERYAHTGVTGSNLANRRQVLSSTHCRYHRTVFDILYIICMDAQLQYITTVKPLNNLESTLNELLDVCTCDVDCCSVPRFLNEADSQS